MNVFHFNYCNKEKLPLKWLEKIREREKEQMLLIKDILKYIKKRIN